MKTFFKQALYITVLFVFLGAAGSAYFSTRLMNELEQINEIYYENDYLSDAVLICMQLYAIEPTEINKHTCLKIEDELVSNYNEIESFLFASLYFKYLDKMQ